MGSQKGEEKVGKRDGGEIERGKRKDGPMVRALDEDLRDPASTPSGDRG